MGEHFTMWIKRECPFCVNARDELFRQRTNHTIYIVDDNPEEANIRRQPRRVAKKAASYAVSSDAENSADVGEDEEAVGFESNDDGGEFFPFSWQWVCKALTQLV